MSCLRENKMKRYNLLYGSVSELIDPKGKRDIVRIFPINIINWKIPFDDS